MIGRTFGSWTVLEEVPRRYGKRHVRARCTCGAEHVVRLRYLRRGRSTQCRSCAATVHGHATRGGLSPTYETWRNMRARCNDPQNPSWRWYGELGVRVCARWDESFLAFLEDVGERPEGRTLDRIDPTGDYAPGNVRWATALEQAQNKRARAPGAELPDSVFQDAI